MSEPLDQGHIRGHSFCNLFTTDGVLDRDVNEARSVRGRGRGQVLWGRGQTGL